MANVKNIVFGLAIMILTIFVSVYGINTLYDQPEYNDFCSSERFPLEKPVSGDEDRICPQVCVEMYEISSENGGTCVFNECGSGCGPNGVDSFDTLKQCQIVLEGKSCSEEYSDAMEKYSRNVFFVALPLGIIIVAIGAYFFALESVGAGLMLGGAGTLIYGANRYWGYADEWLKFLLSLAGLIALIAFAYWFNQKDKNFWKRFFKGK